MTKHEYEKLDGINFRVGTQKHTVYKMYKNGLDCKAISEQAHLPIKNVQFYIWNIKKLMGVVTSTAVETREENKILTVEIEEQGDSLLLKVKACKEFEDYLIANKQLKTTDNLFGRGETGKYYQLRIVDNYLDDINYPVICNNMINFAVLRVKGISNGLSIAISELITENQLNSAMKKLLKTYKEFISRNIENNRIHLQGEVIVQ